MLVPNLLSLTFWHCDFLDAGGLPGVTALQSLTRLVFSHGHTPPYFDRQLVQLPCLQHMEYAPCVWVCDNAPVGLTRLPADMGSLSLSLVHLDIRGRGLTQFPLALTQLVALKCLYASRSTSLCHRMGGQHCRRARMCTSLHYFEHGLVHSARCSFAAHWIS